MEAAGILSFKSTTHSSKAASLLYSIPTPFSKCAAALNSVTDLVLALLPAVLLWRLNLKLSKRVGLILVTSLGLL